MTQADSVSSLPPFLRDSPTEPEELPLQVSLLTMEVAQLRLALTRLALMLGQTAEAAQLYKVPGITDG